MSEPAHPKKPINMEELKRLKLLKKEAKQKMNAKKPQIQQAPPKAMERVFENVAPESKLENLVGNLRIMTFNVSLYYWICYVFILILEKKTRC
jgi:hypothetical protein